MKHRWSLKRDHFPLHWNTYIDGLFLCEVSTMGTNWFFHQIKQDNQIEPQRLFLLVPFITRLATHLWSPVLKETAKALCGNRGFSVQGSGGTERSSCSQHQSRRARGSCYIWLAQQPSKLWGYGGYCLDQFFWPWGWQNIEPESQGMVQTTLCIFSGRQSSWMETKSQTITKWQ